MGTVQRILSRWFLPFVALLSAGTTLAFAGLDPDNSILDTLLGGALALALAGLLFVVGYRYFTTTDLPETDARTVALWTVAGIALYATVSGWSLALRAFAEGVGSQLSIVTTLTAGAFGGAVFGIAIARARRDNEQKQALADYRELFDKAEDGIALNDPETGAIGEVNQRYAEMVGYDVDELRDMRIEEISADDPSFDQEAAMRRIRQVVEGESQQFDWLFEHKDGTHVWAEVSLKRTTIGGDVRLLAFLRDISERKARERDLLFFEELVETIGVGVAVYGEDGRFEYINEAYAEILGTDRETLAGEMVWDINPEVDRERFDDYWNSFDDGEIRTSETVHAFEGDEVTVETVTTCREINDTLYHFGTVQDVTDRKEQEERFRAFVEQSNDILTILSSDGTYQYQSPSAERILGYDSAEMVGNDAFEYIHPDDRESMTGRFQEAFTDPDATPVAEYRFRNADGSWRWLESRGNNQFDNPAIEGFVVNSRDITRRKRHEHQMADLHDATRGMIHATDERDVCEIAIRTAENVLEFPITGIWLSDESGDRLEPAAATDAAETLFGDLPVYTDGNSPSWRAFVTEESFVLDDRQEESQFQDPDTRMRSELVVPLGEYGVLNVGSTDPNTFTDNDVALAKLLAANTQAALGRAERERTLERQTDQMEFFNSILRHDVLNAVTVIKSRAEFLQEDLEGEQLRDAVTIVKWSNDVDEIVQRVRTVLETLTGEGDPELVPMDLGVELGAEVDRIESTYPDVAFDTAIPDGLPVLANDLLGDVLGNIVTNAIDHNDTDGLRVSVTVEEDDEWVTTRIADNGRGVPGDHKEAIFRRDETGHAKSTGSGFGLFFVDVMVAEYGGDVWVEDNDDGGATFVVRLPSVDRTPLE